MMNEQFKTDVFYYLDYLRKSGVINIFSAGQYIEKEFGLNRQASSELLQEWMYSFSERYAND